MSGSTPTAFFNKTFDETMGLLLQLRDYIAELEPRDRMALPPALGVRLSCEAMRVTARLTQIMAWLLAQKAVHAGEIAPEEAIGQHEPLAEISACMSEETEDETATLLPKRFQGLLEQSRRLYIRVARLDEMVRRQVS